MIRFSRYQPERQLLGGICTHQSKAPFHGARNSNYGIVIFNLAYTGLKKDGDSSACQPNRTRCVTVVRAVSDPQWAEVAGPQWGLATHASCRRTAIR